MRLAEWFYSIQGEGVTAGVPSLFIRFAGCNFMCGGFKGALVGKENDGKQVTWWCDTEPVWKAGRNITTQALMEEIKEAYPDLLWWLRQRKAHIIFTGGEPLLPQNMEAIIEIDQWLKRARIDAYYEVETNASIAEDYGFFHQVNASPKLANSGMPRALRQNENAIDRIIDHPNGWFKFVVNTEDDIKEIETEWVKELEIPEDRIILMPGVDKLVDLQRTSQFAAEKAIERGWRFTTRLQIVCWDATTGV